MIIRQNWATEQELTRLEDWVLDVAFRPVPKWLGNFSFKYGMALPADIQAISTRLGSLCPSQLFNTTFIQRYEVGQSVKNHRDPLSNVGQTLILVFGSFTGAETEVSGMPAGRLNRGDVGQLTCSVHGVHGPWHEVSPVLSGTRYAMILNTVVK